MQLPYTLQTTVGMVLDNGRPKRRDLPPDSHLPQYQIKDANLKFPIFKSFTQYLKYKPPSIISETAITCLSISSTPHWSKLTPERARYQANIAALQNPAITTQVLLSYIHTRCRIDLEQAAGAIVSALVNDGKKDEAVKLVRHLGGVLGTSCMWILTDEEPKTTTVGTSTRFSHLVRRLKERCSPIHDVGNPTTYAQLLPILLRIRSKTKPDRCCQIPNWMFKQANMEVPPHIMTYYVTEALAPCLKGSLYPQLPPSDDSIMLTHRPFSIIQRLIHAVFKHWKPDIVLRQGIKHLESRVLYDTEFIDKKVKESAENTLIVALYFFAFQRRLQRKVVSDFGWTTFLKKGEGSRSYQNNLDMVSTFDEELRSLSGAEVVPTQENLMELIDETCMLMERYVQVYGQGVKSNLTFVNGVKGGTGRGPVDDYNLLCDILIELRKQARQRGYENLPGAVHKFLAKDIMSWNNSWGDDAFAGGKVPGWEIWLEERRQSEIHK